jgi:outer membrane protein assembly factor BamB
MPVSVGVVTLVEGKVQFKASPSAAWKDADIGDTIPVTGAVKTEEAASCELQFGKTAIVHIMAKSTLEIRAIDISQAKRSVELSLLNGALVAKVDKLVGTKDRFQVRTDAAVCAVRGTRFLVRCASDSSTSVAVSEGSVALIPASYDAAHFEVTTTNTATDNNSKEELAATLAHGLLNGSPLVEPDQEATVTKASLVSLDKVLARAVEAIDSGDKAALTKALDDYRNAVGGSSSPASTTGEDSRRIFQETKDLHISDNLPPIKETAPAEKAVSLSPTAQGVRHLSLQVDPADSLVLVDGKDMGQGNRDIEIALGSKISLVLRHKGYEDYREDIDAGTAQADPLVRSLRLKPLAIYSTVPVSRYPLIGGLAVADGRIYAADSHAQISAFDREGKVYWSVDSKNGSNENSSPVAQGGLVLFAGGKELALYDGASGEARSSFDLGKEDSGLFGRRPLLVGGKVLLSSEAGLAVFDPAGKVAASTAALPEASDASLSAYGEDAVILTRGGILCVVDGTGLAVKAQIKTGATQPIAVRPIIKGDLAYLVDRKGLVSCVDLVAKKLLWEKRLASGASVEAFSDPLVTDTGLYVVAKSALYALSSETGESLFRPIVGVDSSPVEGDGLLWLGAEGKSITGLDPKTGAKTVTIKVGAPVSAAPVASGDLLAFPLADGRVVFINPKYRL